MNRNQNSAITGTQVESKEHKGYTLGLWHKSQNNIYQAKRE